MGSPTIGDLIVQNRQSYFDALDAADAAWSQGQIDLSVMEELIESLVARQLTTYFQQAGGRVEDEAASDPHQVGSGGASS